MQHFRSVGNIAKGMAYTSRDNKRMIKSLDGVIIKYIIDGVLNVLQISVLFMLPNIVTPSQLRQNLSAFLSLAGNGLVVVKSKGSNKVIMDEKEYNRLSALANQFMNEDPEGKYLPDFEKEILEISKNPKINPKIKSLRDIVCS